MNKELIKQAFTTGYHLGCKSASDSDPDKRRRDYAVPVGLLGGTFGGLLASDDLAGLSSVEDFAHRVSARRFGPDVYFESTRAPLMSESAVMKNSARLLSNPSWLRAARKGLFRENLAVLLSNAGKVGGRAAAVGIPVYAVAKLVQNLARAASDRKKK